MTSAVPSPLGDLKWNFFRKSMFDGREVVGAGGARSCIPERETPRH